MQERAHYKMDGKLNDSKWTHNTSAAAAAWNHILKVDFLTLSSQLWRWSVVVNFTFITVAAGQSTLSLIIHKLVSALHCTALKQHYYDAPSVQYVCGHHSTVCSQRK